MQSALDICRFTWLTSVWASRLAEKSPLGVKWGRFLVDIIWLAAQPKVPRSTEAALFELALNIAVLCYPLSLPVFLGAMLCIAIGAQSEGAKRKSSVTRWCLLPFTIPIAILLLGGVLSLWTRYPKDETAAEAALTLLKVLLFVQLLVASGLLALAESWRPRLFVFGWSLLQGLASFCTYFVSYMAITGDAL